DAVLVADVVERADVRVRELRDRLRLSLESLPHLGGRREMLRQHFDRDRALEARVLRLVDLAHPSRSDGGQDFVGSEPGTGGNGHRREASSSSVMSQRVAWPFSRA